MPSDTRAVEALGEAIEAAEHARHLTLRSEFAEFIVDDTGRAFIAAVLAVLQENGWTLTDRHDTLDAAWARVERALPEGYQLAYWHRERRLAAWRGNDILFETRGTDPLPALTSLAEKLEGTER